MCGEIVVMKTWYEDIIIWEYDFYLKGIRSVNS